MDRIKTPSGTFKVTKVRFRPYDQFPRGTPVNRSPFQHSVPPLNVRFSWETQHYANAPRYSNQHPLDAPQRFAPSFLNQPQPFTYPQRHAFTPQLSNQQQQPPQPFAYPQRYIFIPQPSNQPPPPPPFEYPQRHAFIPQPSNQPPPSPFVDSQQYFNIPPSSNQPLFHENSKQFELTNPTDTCTGNQFTFNSSEMTVNIYNYTTRSNEPSRIIGSSTNQLDIIDNTSNQNLNIFKEVPVQTKSKNDSHQKEAKNAYLKPKPTATVGSKLVEPLPTNFAGNMSKSNKSEFKKIPEPDILKETPIIQHNSDVLIIDSDLKFPSNNKIETPDSDEDDKSEEFNREVISQLKPKILKPKVKSSYLYRFAKGWKVSKEYDFEFFKLAGSKNQTDSQQYKNQCVTNCSAGIIQACFVPPFEWNTATIDYTLSEGDQLYGQIISARKMKNGDFLRVSCLPNETVIFGENLKIGRFISDKKSTWRCGNVDKPHNYMSRSATLDQVVREFFSQDQTSKYCGAVIIANDCARSIFRYGSKFYIFDSHKSKYDRNAILLEFDSIDHLSKIIVDLMKGPRSNFDFDYIQIEKFDDVSNTFVDICPSNSYIPPIDSSDYESDYEDLPEDFETIHGTVNQNHFSFSNQCVSMSATAVVKAHYVHPNMWRGFMNKILEEGNRYYGETIENLRKVKHVNISDGYLLTVGELNRNVTLFAKPITIASESSLNNSFTWKCGPVKEREGDETLEDHSENALVPLRIALRQLFEAGFVGGVVTSQNYSRAVIKRDDDYILFDSHPIAKNGRATDMNSEDPAAIIITKNFETLFSVLYDRIKFTFFSCDLNQIKNLKFKDLQYDLDYIRIHDHPIYSTSTKIWKKSTENCLDSNLPDNNLQNYSKDNDHSTKLPPSSNTQLNSGSKWNMSFRPKPKTNANLKDQLVTNVHRTKERCDQIALKTYRGNKLVQDEDGHLYFKSHSKSDTTYYRCIESCNKNITCTRKVHIHVDENIPVFTGDDHNHPVNLTKINKRISLAVAKEAIVDNPRTKPKSLIMAIRQVLNNDCNSFTEASLRKLIQRYQRKTIPKSHANRRRDLDIEDRYKVTIEGEPFLLYDSGKLDDSDYRMLIFSETRLLQLIAEALMLMWDGTFNVSKLFKQLVTFHASFPDIGSIPLLYAFLSGRSEKTYREFIRVVRILVQKYSNNPTWNGPAKVVCDFELAFINAVQKEFPNTKIEGCMFHHAECIYRKIKRSGLQKFYEKNEYFSLKMRVLAALAYLPPDEVQLAYRSLCYQNYFYKDENGNFFEKNIINGIQMVLRYFNDVWVGTTIILSEEETHVCRKARYDVNIWNAHDRTLKDEEKTVNKLEGWHHGINLLVPLGSDMNLTFHTLIQQHDDNLRRLYFNSGEETAVKEKKAYRIHKKAIRKAVEHYINPACFKMGIDFLERVAHRLQFQESVQKKTQDDDSEAEDNEEGDVDDDFDCESSDEDYSCDDRGCNDNDDIDARDSSDEDDSNDIGSCNDNDDDDACDNSDEDVFIGDDD